MRHDDGSTGGGSVSTFASALRRVRVAVESNEGRAGLSPVISLAQTSGTLDAGLRSHCEVTTYPAGLGPRTPQQRREFAERLVADHDVVVGCPDDALLDARQRLRKKVAFVFLVPGAMSRGGAQVSRLLPQLRTSDVFVVNSRADAAAVGKFLANARVRLLPWVVRDSVFSPMTKVEASARRRSLGFGDDDRIVLYAGRLSLEKNVHTLLRMFSVVRKLEPTAHLVLAGEAPNIPFLEFGVFPLRTPMTLGHIVTSLGLHESVRYIGHVAQRELRSLYNVADVAINLTLHHAENFGLAQVEALACGTPVIGTLWGGLKDTIVPNTTGYGVSAIVSESGVKASWWEAVAHLIRVLRGREKDALREGCLEFARQFSQSRHNATIGSIVAEALDAANGPAEPVRATAFGEAFWSECGPRPDSPPPYQRSRRAFELYRSMIDAYAGLSNAAIGFDVPLEPDQVLSLAAPIQRPDAGAITINDPIFPTELSVPRDICGVVSDVLDTIVERPVTTVARLFDGAPSDGARRASDWLLRSGVLLRTADAAFDVAAEKAAAAMSAPLVRIQRVSHDVDFVVKAAPAR